MSIPLSDHTRGFMKIFLALSLFVVCPPAAAQKWIDRAGKASFFSSAPMEDIEAHSRQVVSILDVQSGELVASMLMRSFNFRKALMEEHFNETYVESHKYPKATFKGKVENIDGFSPGKDGKYALRIKGEITLHGVTKPLEMLADASVSGGRIQAKAVFPLTVADFRIKIPRLVINNIAEKVEVTVVFNYQKM